MGIRLFPNQVNFIKSIILHPCARPWYIYVETFLPAFLKLMITVSIFDVNDAIRAHGETIARGDKGKKGKRHTPRVKTIQRQTTIQRYAQKGLKILLVVTKPLETIGFNWLLYSAVDEFFYDWQTLLENSDFCVDKGQAGPLTRQRGPGFVSLVIAFIPVPLPILSQNRAGWGTNFIGASLPLGTYQAVFALTVIGPLFGISNLKIRIRTPGAQGDDITESEPIALAEGAEGDMVVTHLFRFPLVGFGSIVWEIGGATVPIGIDTVKGYMSVFRTLP